MIPLEKGKYYSLKTNVGRKSTVRFAQYIDKFVEPDDDDPKKIITIYKFRTVLEYNPEKRIASFNIENQGYEDDDIEFITKFDDSILEIRDDGSRKRKSRTRRRKSGTRRRKSGTRRRKSRNRRRQSRTRK